MTVQHVDPLPIGTCGNASITVIDPVAKGHAHNLAGHYVAAADFDMDVESAGQPVVVGKYEGRSIWSAYACQTATVGTRGTITATYPAKSLPAASRVPGVSFTSRTPFTIGLAKSKYNPPGCDALKTAAAGAASKTGSTPAAPATSPAQPATSPVQPVTVLPPINTATAVPLPPAPPPVTVLPPMNTATAIPLPPPAPAPAQATTAKMTSFNPVKHGFQFVNTFKNSPLGPPINMETSGLCGGMTYTVLDYFNANREMSNQTYRPANGTILQQYIYDRQMTSLLVNADKWVDLSMNPFGSRTMDFFNRGISSQLAELRTFIDRGVPVTLGLKGSEGTMAHDHQVLAIGYDIGRYQGALGDYKYDVKIFIFDPNHPNKTMTLVPNVGALEYHYVEEVGERWRTFFVDDKYATMVAPVVTNPKYPNDGLAYELLFEFGTGYDDMRGGADHVDVTLRLTNGSTQPYTNISQGGRWITDYNETARVILTQPLAPSAIQGIEVSTNSTGEVNDDQWDMTSVLVTATGGNFTKELAPRTGAHNFTGNGIPFVFVTK